MQELSRAEQILAEKTVCVLLVRGEAPGGTPIYAYVGVKADRLSDFMKAQLSGTFYPEEYGAVLASGEGEPTAEVRRQMEEEYGFDHSGMLDIPDADNAVRLAAEMSKRQGGEPA